MLSSKITYVGRRMYRSIPLVPVYCSLFIFMAMLSPVFWSTGSESYLFLIIAVGLGLICAYSTTIFVDEIVRIKAKD